MSRPTQQPAARTRPGEDAGRGRRYRPDAIAEVAWWRAAAIGAAALALALGLLYTIWLLGRALALLLAAVIIASALAPIVNWLGRWLPRALATILVYAAVLATLGGVGWITIPSIVDQAWALLATGPTLLERAQDIVDRWSPSTRERILQPLESSLASAGMALISLPLAVLSSALEIVLVIILSIYWVIAQPDARRFTLSLFPPCRREEAADVLSEAGTTIGGYLRATAIDAVIIGVVTYVALLVIGVRFPLVLGLIAALGEFVPNFGPILAAVPAIAVALLDSPTQALVVALLYLAVQQFESNVLLPNVLRQQSDIPPVLALFALFAGAGVGGLLGALVAIPLFGALRVLVLRVVAPAIRHWSGAADPRGDASGDAAP